MILTLDEARALLPVLFVDREPPRPFSLIEPAIAVREQQTTLKDAARSAHTTQPRLAGLAGSQTLLEDLVGHLPPYSVPEDEKTRSTLGQLMIGEMAERVFSDIWTSSLADGDLHLRDDRAARGDTDFLVEDSSGRQMFRLNIKFHGSTFRRAAELVGLEPEDVFALATYKIHAALVKQDAEHLPYMFVVVGVRGLTGGSVGELIPDPLVRFTALARLSGRVQGKRAIEEAVVAHVLNEPGLYGLRTQLEACFDKIRAAEWRFMSARRADKLLRDLLFERAYALRVRGFARNYQGAELDMHFSVSHDLNPLATLFSTFREDGITGLVS